MQAAGLNLTALRLFSLPQQSNCLPSVCSNTELPYITPQPAQLFTSQLTNQLNSQHGCIHIHQHHHRRHGETPPPQQEEQQKSLKPHHQLSDRGLAPTPTQPHVECSRGLSPGCASGGSPGLPRKFSSDSVRSKTHADITFRKRRASRKVIPSCPVATPTSSASPRC
jgi:hypothetical protein